MSHPRAGVVILHRTTTSTWAIDSASAGYAPAFDLLGRMRCDTPSVANSGSGTPPYIDRGAFEYCGN